MNVRNVLAKCIRSILIKTNTNSLHSNSIHSISHKNHDQNFFSGRNNDRAPARQKTRTFFSGRNNDRAPARQMTRTFFFPTRYFPPEPKKLTQHHNCMVLQVHSSMYNQNLFPARTKNWHNSTTGEKTPPAHAKRGQVPPAHTKRVYLFLPPSVRPSVSEG